MAVFAGQITARLGAVPIASCASIANIESFKYAVVPQPNIVPVNVMNEVAPVGFFQKHKWVEGEIQTKTEADAAIHSQATDYLPAGEASPSVPSFAVELLDIKTADKWTVNIVGARFQSEELVQGHEKEGLMLYKFIAKTATLTKG